MAAFSLGCDRFQQNPPQRGAKKRIGLKFAPPLRKVQSLRRRSSNSPRLELETRNSILMSMFAKWWQRWQECLEQKLTVVLYLPSKNVNITSEPSETNEYLWVCKKSYKFFKTTRVSKQRGRAVIEWNNEEELPRWRLCSSKKLWRAHSDNLEIIISRWKIIGWVLHCHS